MKNCSGLGICGLWEVLLSSGHFSFCASLISTGLSRTDSPVLHQVRAVNRAKLWSDASEVEAR